ncbi:hypothetical protein FRC11_012475, partial [Ceratobasidium sp. 423]
FRYRNSEKEQPPSLYYSTTAGVALNRKFERHPNVPRDQDPGNRAAGFTGGKEKPAKDYPGHIIIASEPTTKEEKEWTPIDKNKAVLVDFPDKKLRYRIEDIS